MKSFLSALRPLRFLVAVCVCALLVFSYVAPGYAAGYGANAPRRGEAESAQAMKKMEDKGREILEAGEPTSLERVQSESNRGLNEVQGAAGAEDMKRPSNSQGSTVEQRIQNALEKAQDKVDETVK
jgi:hypothetical protein